MLSVNALKISRSRFQTAQSRLKRLLQFDGNRSGDDRRKSARVAAGFSLRMEALEKRALLAAAIMDGDWSNPATWEGGVVPDETQRAIISHGITVSLDGDDHAAKELVVHGNLIVPDGDSDPAQVNKTLTTDWIHVNSGGVFQVGSEADRYDEGTFTLTLTGTDLTADPVIETNMGGMFTAGSYPTMTAENNNGFLMTAMQGRIQLFGEEKLSFTKLAETTGDNTATITIANVIERNFNKGAKVGDEFVTTPEDDGSVNWEVGDQIVIASSSYDYREEEVRTIEAIVDNGNGTSTLTLNETLAHRHYGEIETYGETANAEPGTTPATQTYSIDMRAEVALLSRNIRIQGLASQDTDAEFGDRANMQIETRVPANGLSPKEIETLPAEQVANGVGGHIMIMPDSGQITVDGVQLENMGQASQKGRYPIHWHLGVDRSGDVLKDSSVTNSNNRGVTIHGTSNLHIEGVVLHDVHGHGFFFEDAVETGNVLIGNLALGIHTVGGNDADFASPGTKDPFVVDTHDNALETGSRFSMSSGFWITNPTNTFVGNIVAGMGDQRTDSWAGTPGPAGTGFWYAIPRTALGTSAGLRDSDGNLIYEGLNPIFSEFGQFDYNTSHTTAVGLNFDRGSDIEDANFNFDSVDFGAIQPANEYAPRVDGVEDNPNRPSTINGFTNYKATDAAFYHRGDGETINLDGLRVADSYNGPWAVSENKYDNSLFVGHSKGNADENAEVGGPRLYDGAGLYTDTHFAGFEGPNAYAFQVEGSSFGPTMYHAFRGTSFEGDGTYGNITHAVSDFTPNPNGHNLGLPSQWIKGALDLDGSLTSAAGGGVGYSIVPKVDFLVDDGDTQPAGWDAYLTNDIYARLRIQNNDDGEALFPSEVTGEPLVRFTAEDGDSIDVMGGQDINGQLYWTQIAAKADDNSDGTNFVEGTLTVEFMRNGVPANGFVLNLDNQDGNRPDIVPEIEARVDAARLVTKFLGAGNYTPNIGTEVDNEDALRGANDGVVYFRDDTGNLYLNTSIVNQPKIELAAGDPLQTAFVSRTVKYGTKIEAVAFDNGIESIAYHDTDTTNSIGSFRNTGVDATANKVGDIADGEWLEYTADIFANEFAHLYRVGVNVSSTAAGGQVRLLAGNNNSVGFLREFATIDVPDTGGSFSTEWVEGLVDLTSFAGTDSVIRLEFVGGGFEVDSVQFDAPVQTVFEDRVIESRTISADMTTTTIELEEYDTGGQNVAYFDETPTNDASDFRPGEAVDAGGGLVTNQINDGEWLEYTTNIHAGLYDITLKKAWGGENEAVKLLIGDSNSASVFTELRTFEFAADGGEDIKFENVDLSQWAGSDRAIRVEMIGSFFGLDRLTFESQTQTAPVADIVADIVDVAPDPSSANAGVVVINFDEDVTGFDINDLALTRDGNAVDISGLNLTSISARQYSIDLSSVTATAGNYELNLGSVGSGIQDAAGNALATDAVDQFVVNEDQDFGDAPAPYPTTLAADGARHGPTGPRLGALRDGEANGQPNSDASGDGSDDDGVLFGAIAANSSIAAVNIDLQNAPAGVADAWIDFNRDGDWDDLGEQVLDSIAVVPGMQTINFTVDPSFSSGQSFARVRVSKAGGLSAVGIAPDGEVEDYQIQLGTPASVQQSSVNAAANGSRSELTSIEVEFDTVVALDSSSFELLNVDTNEVITGVSVVSESGSGVTRATLAFTGGPSVVVGNGTMSPSLANGTYQLNYRPTGNSASSQSVEIDDFFRKYGDANGDNLVSLTDFSSFRSAFGSSFDPNNLGNGFDSGLDADRDGSIGLTDFAAFRQGFGN